jgi:hypothetical protein
MHGLLQVSGAMVHRIMSNTTMPFSNMIGPVEQVEFYGHRIVYIAPSVYGLPSVWIKLGRAPLWLVWELVEWTGMEGIGVEEFPL